MKKVWGFLQKIKIRGHLNSPKELFSPLSMLVLIIWMCNTYIIFFKWSIWQLGIGVLIDRITVLLIAPLAFKKFYEKYPNYKILVEGKIDRLDESELNEEFISSLQSFPERFSFFCLVVGIFKSITSGIYAISQWDHQRPFLFSFAYVFLLMTIALVNFYGFQFVELHIWATKELKRLSEKFNLKPIFEKVHISTPNENFFWAEVSSYLTVIVALFLCMGLAFSEFGRLNYSFLIQYSLIVVSSMFLLAREFYLFRMFFFRGLSNLLDAMNDRSFIEEQRELPLSSSLLMAKFEQVFNKMNKDLRQKIYEVQNWTNYATARTRIQTLGEASAIIAHDLAKPVHSMKLFMEELQNNPDKIAKSPELINKMNGALGNCEDLIQSLRSSLKESNGEISSQTTSVREVYGYAAHSVQSLIRNSDELRIGSSFRIKTSFNIDEGTNAADALLALSKLDAIHIFTNLLNNAAQELLASRVTNPFISMNLRGINSETIEIRIIDNGRGLTPEQFEALTSDVSLFRGHFASVGLHLIRRMIEQRGGRIWIESPQSDLSSHGTVVAMRLSGRLVKENRHEKAHLDT